MVRREWDIVVAVVGCCYSVVFFAAAAGPVDIIVAVGSADEGRVGGQ